jgi:small ligand-binding sensory domain FIST
MSKEDHMMWVSVGESGSNLSTMLAAGAEKISARMVGKDPHVLIVFITPHFAEIYPHVPGLLHHHFPESLVVGCSAGGIIGGGQEMENRPAVSMTAGYLPGVTLHPFHSDTQDLPDEDASPDMWRRWLGYEPETNPHFMILADPFSAQVEPFLNGLDYTFPHAAKIGGLSSGGKRSGENALFFNRQVFNNGLICVGFSGNIALDTIVAQGCRPIGRPLVVTRCQQNILYEVDHESPLVYLNRIFQDAPEYDRQLMRNALFLGITVDTLSEPGEAPPCLIRNLIGADYKTGSVAVGSLLREGQIVQFHLRDRQTSQEDLHLMLTQYASEHRPHPEAGALLFSCLGRGQYLYGEPHYDSANFLDKIGPLALGGFFCNGEIGPVGGATFIHGYTSAFGIFRPASP